MCSYIKTTFKIWNFYFTQILAGIVEKHVLTAFNFFFKFLHSLTLFPIFSVHVNWIAFYITAHFFKFCYQHILRKKMGHLYFPAPGPGPQFVFTGPDPRFVFTDPGPQFVFTGPSPQFVFNSPDPEYVITGPGTKFVFTGPGL